MLKKFKNCRTYFQSSSVKNFIVYLSSGGVSKMIPMIILFLIAKFLSPEEFGLISNFGVIVNLIGGLASMKLSQIIQSDFYNQTAKARRIAVSNVIYLQTILITLLILVSVLAAPIVYKALLLDLRWVFTAGLVAFFTNVFEIRTVILRMEEKPRQFAYFQMGFTLLVAVLNVLLVIYLDLGWHGRVYATFLASFLIFILTLLYLAREGWLLQRMDFAIIKKYFFQGLPLIPLTIAPFINGNIAKIILTKELGLESNGIYSFAMTVTTIVQLLTLAFYNTYVPILYKKLSENTIDSSKVLYQDIIKIVPIFLVVFIIADLSASFAVGLVFNDGYLDSIQYFPWLFLRLFLQSIYLLFSYYFLYLKKLKIVSFLSFSSAGLNILLCYFLVPSYGIYGAVFALIIMLIYKITVANYYVVKGRSTVKLT